MYLPYVRGKQYELIALRELFETSALSESISPIIEPVKRSTTALIKTLKTLAVSNVNFTLILNPQKGELINRLEDILEVLGAVGSYSNFQIGIIVTTEVRLNNLKTFLVDKNLEQYHFSLIHYAELQNIHLLNDFEQLFNVKYHVINYDRIKGRRYYRNFRPDTLVTLEDQFSMQQRNVDYLKYPEEKFSEELWFYSNDGYIGFSDFATIGESFSEGGFLPYAVAIHLTFLRGDSIFVRHFVSDSNDDNSDVPGKFAEALNHLIAWVSENNPYETTALKEFKRLHSEQHYPGLGSIKKLSLMHHIELVNYQMTI